MWARILTGRLLLICRLWHPDVLTGIARVVIEQNSCRADKQHYPNESRYAPIRENESGRETGEQTNQVRHQERPVGSKDGQHSTGDYGSEEDGQKLLRSTKGCGTNGFQTTIGAFMNSLEGSSSPRHPADIQLRPDLAVDHAPHEPAQNSSKPNKHASTIAPPCLNARARLILLPSQQVVEPSRRDTTAQTNSTC